MRLSTNLSDVVRGWVIGWQPGENPWLRVLACSRTNLYACAPSRRCWVDLCFRSTKENLKGLLVCVVLWDFTFDVALTGSRASLARGGWSDGSRWVIEKFQQSVCYNELQRKSQENVEARVCVWNEIPVTEFLYFYSKLATEAGTPPLWETRTLPS